MPTPRTLRGDRALAELVRERRGRLHFEGNAAGADRHQLGFRRDVQLQGCPNLRAGEALPPPPWIRSTAITGTWSLRATKSRAASSGSRTIALAASGAPMPERRQRALSPKTSSSATGTNLVSSRPCQ